MELAPDIMKTAIEQSSEPIVVTDAKGAIVYANPAFEELTGYSEAEVLGTTHAILKSEKTPRSTFDELWRTLRAGGTWRGEFVNRRKDGTEYVEKASIAPVRGADGAVTHYIALKQDITLLRKAELHLAERQRLIRAILAATPVGIGLYRNARMLWTNEAFSSITGYSRQELARTPIEELVPDLSAEASLREMMQRAREGGLASAEVALSRKDRSRLDARIQACLVERDSPDYGIVVTLVDVTETRKLDESLRDSVEQLTKRAEAMEAQRLIIEREKERGDELVSAILPASVAEELLLGNPVVPRRFESVTVMFTDFVGFSALASKAAPEFLISELNDMFSAFDAIMEKRGCERIKTLGDGYLAVSGAPDPRADHADAMLDAAMDCFRYLEFRNSTSRDAENGIDWKIRVGIDSGPVVGGIIGTRKYLYDIIGDTVNVASRLQSAGETMRIHVGAATKALASTRFRFTDPRTVALKNVGPVETWYLALD